MFAPLALTLLTAVAPPAVRHDDPVIRLTLSEENYVRGDRAKVRVRAAENGYLLVLRVDGNGRVRVLYPLRPDDYGEITAGKEFEVRNRGDREAFVVDEDSGTGTVLAAWSAQPFQFDAFSTNGRWNYRALAADTISGDGESGLLDLVDRMSNGKYDYDVAQYLVGEREYRSHYSTGFHSPWYGGYYSPFYGPRWSIGFGWGGGYGWHRRRW